MTRASVSFINFPLLIKSSIGPTTQYDFILNVEHNKILVKQLLASLQES